MDPIRKADLRRELELMMEHEIDAPRVQQRVANLARIVWELLNEIGPTAHAEAVAKLQDKG